MGQAMRMMKYDYATNERNAVTALKFAGHPLHWFRLDDGVMGGQSETQHHIIISENDNKNVLHFAGTINTNGGGFASIRTPIVSGDDDGSCFLAQANCKGVKLRLRGDGKTYKFFLSDGSRMGPMARKPTWQVDIPTTAQCNDKDGDGDEWQEVDIDFDNDLLPSWGGGPRGRPDEDKKNYKFDKSEMREMGLMLSLKLSDGRPNPEETYGKGIFPFSLFVQSIEPIEKN